MLGFEVLGKCKCGISQEKLTFHNNDSLKCHKCHTVKYNNLVFLLVGTKTPNCHIIPEGLSYIYIYTYTYMLKSY